MVPGATLLVLAVNARTWTVPLFLGDAPKPRHPASHRRLQEINSDSNGIKRNFRDDEGRVISNLHLKQNYGTVAIYRLVNSGPELHLPRAAGRCKLRSRMPLG